MEEQHRRLFKHGLQDHRRCRPTAGPAASLEVLVLATGSAPAMVGSPPNVYVALRCLRSCRHMCHASTRRLHIHVHLHAVDASWALIPRFCLHRMLNPMVESSRPRAEATAETPFVVSMASTYSCSLCSTFWWNPHLPTLSACTPLLPHTHTHTHTHTRARARIHMHTQMQTPPPAHPRTRAPVATTKLARPTKPRDPPTAGALHRVVPVVVRLQAKTQGVAEERAAILDQEASEHAHTHTHTHVYTNTPAGPPALARTWLATVGACTCSPTRRQRSFQGVHTATPHVVRCSCSRTHAC